MSYILVYEFFVYPTQSRLELTIAYVACVIIHLFKFYVYCALDLCCKVILD